MTPSGVPNPALEASNDGWVSVLVEASFDIFIAHLTPTWGSARPAAIFLAFPPCFPLQTVDGMHSYLSHLTGNAYFHETAQRASDAVEIARLELRWEGSKKAGLAPVFVDPGLGLFGESGGSVGVGSSRVTLGARGDSYYEYLLKQWLLSGKR